MCRRSIICWRLAARPDAQLMGQLPPQQTTPGPVFNTVRIDFAGPLLTRYSHTRKPVLVKTYVCVFVSLTVKSVHLDPVSDLTTEAFLAAFRRFISRRGRPKEVFTDQGTNFVGADKEISAIYQHLAKDLTQEQINRFSLTQGIKGGTSSHFGGLWEAAVKSMKLRLCRIMGETKFNYEELTTVLCQIEACLNSRPWCAVTRHDEDGIDILTPGHFRIGQPLGSLPGSSTNHKSG